ncbi:DUF599 domain-containing protein [Ideonella azotifigens]|uniref:DUF599 domain-containing protein n=1 Tax=Ideonella azotifigens TaxID=513160 RepID=A0ABP3V1L7_9BURK|nr:DUF599 domain-containing protein [Ideonella azotifigens]MCD2341078.1 DUF599 domain-containing protein [Ideonella azotifigens]
MRTSLLDALSLLSGLDWLALLVFFGGWAGYASFARRRATTRASVLGSTNHERRLWMRRTTQRENRILDGMVTQSMSSSPSFFASTTILIIGGLLAVISAGVERTEELVRDLPFAAHTSALVLEMKLVLLLGIFIYAFFRFTWSIRQYSFGALLVASAPLFDEPWTEAERDAFADRAGGVMALAAEAFNDGLRGYYMAFAVVGWFFSPWIFVAATVGVIWVLFRREFHSEVLALLAR